MTTPQQALEEGRKLLAPILETQGFVFRLGETVQGSGGHFAEASFIRGDRKLGLWFRFELSAGYEYCGKACSNENLIWAVAGEEGQNRYPGYGGEPMEGFKDLAYDLEHFAKVFVSGTDTELKDAFARAASRPARSGLKGI